MDTYEDLPACLSAAGLLTLLAVVGMIVTELPERFNRTLDTVPGLNRVPTGI